MPTKQSNRTSDGSRRSGARTTPRQHGLGGDVFTALDALPRASDKRLRFFESLPVAIRDVGWRELREAVELGREE